MRFVLKHTHYTQRLTKHEVEQLSITFRNAKTYKRRDTNNKYGPNLNEGCRTKEKQAVASGRKPHSHTARQLRGVNKTPANSILILEQ